MKPIITTNADAETELAVRSQNLVRLIRPILVGENPIAVSAALADLTAMLLAGYQGADDVDVTKARAHLLAEHVKLIQHLVPVNEIALADRLVGAAAKTKLRGK